jgi:hypothetical protein
MEIIGFDTETTLKDRVHEFYSAQFYSPEWDLNDFITDPDELFNLLDGMRKDKVMLQNNVQFDLCVLKNLFQKRCKIKAFFNKSDFISGKLITKSASIKFYDLGNIFPSSTLAQIGEILGLPKMEKPVYLGKRAPETSEERSYFIRYAMRDAEISYDAGKFVMEKFGVLKMTLPSLAVSIFKRDFFGASSFRKMDEKFDEEIKDSYRGGRVEAWIRGSPDQPVYAYDVNSLYPFVMERYLYPFVTNNFQTKDDTNFEFEGVADCLVLVDGEIPLLGIRKVMKDGYKKLIFPQGKFRGWFTYRELRTLEDIKMGKVLKIYKAYEWRSTYRPFRSYIRKFYDLKNQSEKGSGFYKLMMNALYGKFAQDCMGDELEWDENDKVKRKEVKRKNYLRNFVLAAYITAGARCYMARMIKKYVGFENLCYHDTDSLHTLKKLPLKLVNKEMGNFKLEGVTDNPFRATYIRAKFYIFNNKFRCRGLERIITTDNMRELIKNNKVTVFVERIMKMKGAMRRHMKVNQIDGSPRNFSIDNDLKRSYFKDLNGKDLLEGYSKSNAVILNG